LDSTELGLSGKGEVIAVCDTGIDTADTQTIHKDFAGRIKATISYPITRDFASYVNNPGGDDGAADLDSGHGTHVAGSVLGNGSASLDLPGHTTPIRGLAYKAKLVFQAIEQEMKWKNPAYYQKYGRYLLSGIPLDLTSLFSDAYRQKARIHFQFLGRRCPRRIRQPKRAAGSFRLGTQGFLCPGGLRTIPWHRIATIPWPIMPIRLPPLAAGDRPAMVA
jgi:subtilisin family serine protease